MTIDPGKEIRNLFAQAMLQHEAARNLDADGWSAYNKIQAEHAAETRRQELKFLSEYQTRFDVARRKIIDQGGIKDSKLAPRWFGSDNFDVSTIDRQADREVLADHDALLARLRQEKDDRLNALLSSVGEKRPDRVSQFRENFAQMSDRRSGFERRRSR